MKRNLFITILITVVIIFALSGCAEPRYYRVHHEHSERYNRHHRPPPVGVDLNIHN